MEATVDRVRAIARRVCQSISNSNPLPPADHKSRQDIIAFLGTSFTSPALLLHAMFDSNAVLSGSKALDWFVPGSCDSSSDWDFYLMPEVTGVGHLLTVLQNCGVVFEDVWEPLMEVCRSQSQRVFRFSKGQMSMWISHRQHSEVPVPVNCLLDEIISKYSEHDLIQLENGAMIQLHVSPNSDYGGSINIIRGHTTHNDTTQQVQIMFKAGSTPLDHIMAFYASHVQCGITGFGAFHLHYTMATQKKGLIWLGNSQHRPSVDTALQKYAHRGWHFEVSDSCTSSVPIYQHGFEHLSFFMALPFAVDPVLLDIRKAALMNFTWVREGGRTTYIHFLPKAHEDVFNDRRRQRQRHQRQRSGVRVYTDQEHADRKTALQHTTALYWNNQPPPSETLGL